MGPGCPPTGQDVLLAQDLRNRHLVPRISRNRDTTLKGSTAVGYLPAAIRSDSARRHAR